MILETIQDDFVVPLKTARQTTAALANGERTARRDFVRQRVVQGRLAEQRHDELCSEIYAVHHQKEAAASRHVEACRSLQMELAAIEKLQLREISERLPADESLSHRRRELLAELYQLNEKLETEIAEQDKLLPQLEQDRVAAAKQIPVNASELDDELFQTGDPKLLAEFHLAEHEFTSAQRRFELLGSRHLNTPPEVLRDAEAAMVIARGRMRESYNKVLDE